MSFLQLTGTEDLVTYICPLCRCIFPNWTRVMILHSRTRFLLFTQNGILQPCTTLSESLFRSPDQIKNDTEGDKTHSNDYPKILRTEIIVNDNALFGESTTVVFKLPTCTRTLRQNGCVRARARVNAVRREKFEVTCGLTRIYTCCNAAGG